MKSLNKICLTIIAIGILIAFVGEFLLNFSQNYQNLGNFLFENGLRIGQLSGFFMLLQNGTFIFTKYFRWIKFIISFILIGTLIKILHWEFYADWILTIGMASIILIYGISFFKKPIKNLLDYLKLFWVIANFALSIAVFLHLINRDLLQISNYILWLAVIVFVKTKLDSKQLFL